MSRVITADEVRQLQSSGLGDAELADTLVGWIEEPDVRYGVGVSPAELLSLAATHRGVTGDLDTQWELLQRARAAEGATTIDIEAKMIASLALRGQRDEALELADELRHQGVQSLISYLLIASTLSDVEESRQALRWLNMGLRAFERREHSEADDAILQALLTDRYQLRRQAELGKDSYDEEAELILQRWADEQQKAAEGD